MIVVVNSFFLILIIHNIDFIQLFYSAIIAAGLYTYTPYIDIDIGTKYKDISVVVYIFSIYIDRQKGTGIEWEIMIDGETGKKGEKKWL